MSRASSLLSAVATALLAAPLAAQPAVAPPRVVSLGACRLESGATVDDCRVAYRAFGRLSAARDNVVLVPTFFGGKSEDHLFMLGTYVDTTRHHVVIVDALGDGHSSSPSNARGDAAAALDAVTIGDMVEAQRRLLVEHLGVRHLRAVVGISMGGFQAFEWAVRHPGFADAVVPILGSPRPTPYDRLVYETMRDASRAGWAEASRVEALVMRTPRFVNDSGPAHLARSVDELAAAYRAAWSPADYAAQLRAVGAFDVARPFGGDLRRAAAAVRARMLVVWTPDDRIVDPAPARAFARLVGADTLSVPSDCGHAVFWCEDRRIGRAVRAFVERTSVAARGGRGRARPAAR